MVKPARSIYNAKEGTKAKREERGFMTSIVPLRAVEKGPEESNGAGVSCSV